MAGDTSFSTAFIMLSIEVELQDEIVQLVHDKELNSLAPATTEKLVYIYSNWKAVAAVACYDELKIFSL